jgi:hypothetical protein
MLIYLLPLLAPHTITVDFKNTKPISPYIYGGNFTDWGTAGRAVTVDRQGGNRLSAYNWETNASNAGNDYRHQNDGYMGESDEAGLTVRTFLKGAQSHSAVALLTVPTMGYVSADKKGDGDVGNTPNYLQIRFNRSLARKGKPFVYPPSTKDRVVYQDEFVHWIESVKSPQTPVWYSLDNEPDLWGSTHQRVWKKNPTYAQILTNNIEFAGAIKSQAPKSLVFGPANYGWQGFRTFQGAPDANGRDFTDFYLSSMKKAEATAGKRLLDVFDIHWYPEAKGGGERVAFAGDKPATAAARIQAPRSLWDPTYVEDSWIEDTIGHKPIALLPRVMGQIAKNYPGTKLGITEYNYGAGKTVSGMLAQADVLGIFGREGVFAACVFTMGKDDVGMLAGFKAFRDFDGKGGKFGSVGLPVKGTDPAAESVYASYDKGSRRFTLVAINKTSSARPFKIQMSQKGFTTAVGYGRGEGSMKEPKRVAVTKSSDLVSFEAPPLSVVTVGLKSGMRR